MPAYVNDVRGDVVLIDVVAITNVAAHLIAWVQPASHLDIRRMIELAGRHQRALNLTGGAQVEVEDGLLLAQTAIGREEFAREAGDGKLAAYSRDHLGAIERLGDVVGGAQAEPANPLLEAIQCG